MKNKIIVCILAFSLIFSIFPLYSYAESVNVQDSTDQVLYKLIDDILVSLNISSGTIKYSGSLTCYQSSTKSCNATAYLEKRVKGSNSTWVEECHAFASGTYYCDPVGTAKADSKYEYRVRLVCHAYGFTDNYHESDTLYSSVKP